MLSTQTLTKIHNEQPKILLYTQIMIFRRTLNIYLQCFQHFVPSFHIFCVCENSVATLIFVVVSRDIQWNKNCIFFNEHDFQNHTLV